MKKIFFIIPSIVVIFFAMIFFIFALLKFYAKKDFEEDKLQQSKILQLIDNCENVKSVDSFFRSRENTFKYNVTLTFDDGTMLAVGDSYLKDNTLYYGSLFWLGDYTVPYMLYYDGTGVFVEHGRFENVTDSDIIDIYHKNNLSLLLEKKDKMLNFLKSFPLIDEETYKKCGEDKDKYLELIERFELSNCEVLSPDGTIRWIEKNIKWVVLDADCRFSRTES